VIVADTLLPKTPNQPRVSPPGMRLGERAESRAELGIVAMAPVDVAHRAAVEAKPATRTPFTPSGVNRSGFPGDLVT